MKKKKYSLLWQLQYPDTDTVNYLFGTMHVKDQRAFRNLDFILQKITDSDIYIGEINMADIDLNLMQQATQLPNNQQLTNLYTSKKHTHIERIFQRITGQALSNYEHYKPFYVNQVITEKLLNEDMHFFLDKHLFEFAKQEDKRLDGVETFAEQMEIAKQISLKIQCKMLYQTTKNIKKYKAQIQRQTNLYEAGNIYALNKYARKSMGKLRHLIIDKRNHLMADRIANMYPTQNKFITIGAGHLAGKSGVLRLLKQKGLKVKPVRFS